MVLVVAGQPLTIKGDSSMNGERIPATIVTGFLGAGKTTLIRNLIANAEGRRIAVIVNEFGDMGFDGSLIADCGDDDCRPDQILELTNGCICCTVADEFLPTMEALLKRDPAPDHIVIETSGLALPQPLVRAFAWPGVAHRVTVDGVVTVVDAAAVAAGRFAPDPEATRAQLAADPAVDHDDPIEELFEDQLRCADLVVISKADLVSPMTILRRRKTSCAARRAPAPASCAARPATVPLDVLIGQRRRQPRANMAGPRKPPRTGGRGARPRRFRLVRGFARARRVGRCAPKARVCAAMGVPGVLRIKGRAAVAGKAAPALVQAVGPRAEVAFAEGRRAGSSSSASATSTGPR